MKQIWDTEDLASHWSLSFEEIQLLKSKPAVLVHRKFARKPDLSFPIPSHPIPSVTVSRQIHLDNPDQPVFLSSSLRIRVLGEGVYRSPGYWTLSA